ncbi:TPA: Mov34/MPN/PAD-1 family protein [Clostridioides difficile]|uniref:Mov34/MPN/PAD-1 family protein n=1 Tax=Clostridioides difficile TaxID=1496 RepID=UPI000942CCDE|nr:Mov34/MPN/PAD-1 family protein [Clostridioides difficile]MCW0772801.1 Mov34/MPN/PAD-1 family protein [Clostridioides difficile]HBE8719201.1 Mov34/MPN/PAD-1 family protein [Clostridioides difficile]
MIKYKVDKNTILVISDNVISKINKYRQVDGMNEFGGILLGRILSDFTEYEVVDISEPCDKDKSSKYGFIRNKENAQEVVNNAFVKSDGIIQYMGEWHTHPEINPRPSYIDKILLNKCFKNENIPNIIFMLILGNQGELYVGYKNKYTKNVKEIRNIGEE